MIGSSVNEKRDLINHSCYVMYAPMDDDGMVVSCISSYLVEIPKRVKKSHAHAYTHINESILTDKIHV